MLSPIQLEEHKILRIHFDTHMIEGDSAPLVFRHSVVASRQDEAGEKWLVRLDIQFLSEGEGKPAPYKGDMAIGGLFSLLSDFPKEEAEEMVFMNGGAILFGIARELLSSITSRGIHGPVMLPTVDARCFVPEAVSTEG